MKRRLFVKNTALTATALSLSKLIYAATNKNTDSPFLKFSCDNQFLQFEFFSIDSLGKNILQQNVALKPDAVITQMKYYVETSNSSTKYFLYDEKEKTLPAWEIIQKEKSFTVISNYHENYDHQFLFNLSQSANHATLLGIINGSEQKVNLPAILHFPDMGTMRVNCNILDQKIDYDAKRFIEHPYVRVNLTAATESNKKIEYQFEVITIHPDIKGIQNDARYDCFRRNFISLFQLNPFLKILANNSASDACAFTLYEYAEVALHTPQLAENLSAMDLVKMTLDRYLNGTKGYGMLGYDYDKTWDIPESPTSCNTLDTYPSLLISACNYAISTNDKTWFTENYSKLKVWMDKMLHTDLDNDGLFEFCLSGNSGSWKGDSSMRPANWWDTIGFGNKDAYSNALAYHALILLQQAHEKFDMHDEAKLYQSKADQLKNIYTKTFYNNATGILAGWKSADGKLHDYWFVFVNAVAICYDLIETSLANSIMDKILAKMKEVGYTNFELGLPGNLVPVIRADYTDLKPEVGGGKREDNLDGFQIYENGGATACFTLFYDSCFAKIKQETRCRYDFIAIA